MTRAPHFELRRDAEIQSVLKKLFTLSFAKVGVRVEESGQQGLAFAIDYLGGRRYLNIGSDGADHAPTHKN